MLVIYSKTVRKTTVSLLNSCLRILDVLLFFTILVFLYAWLGMAILSGDERSYVFERDPSYDPNINNFNSYFTIVNNLFILFTFDNYPMIMTPFVNQSNVYLAYFLPYMVINILFFIPIPIAVVYDSFKEKSTKIAMEDNLIEKEAMFVCYLTITCGKDRKMSFMEFEQLIDCAYSEKVSLENKKELFYKLDTRKTNKISVLQFLQMMEVVKAHPKLVEYHYEIKIWQKFKAFCNSKFRIKRTVESDFFSYFVLVVIILNTILIILSFFDFSDEFLDILDNIDFYFTLFYILEFVLKIIGMGIVVYFKDNWNKMDFFFIVTALTTDVALSFVRVGRLVKSIKTTRIVRLQRAARISRSVKTVKSFRLIKWSKNMIKKALEPFQRVQTLIYNIVLCLNSIVQIISMLGVTFHIYAVLGMILMDTKTVEVKPSHYPSAISDFNTYPNALFMLLLTITENGWSTFIYDYGIKLGNMAKSAVFFNSFRCLVDFVILSLLTGLIWEIFTIITEYIGYKKKKMKRLEEKEEAVKTWGTIENEAHLLNKDLILAFQDDSAFMNSSKEVVFFREKLHSERDEVVNLIESISLDRDSFTVDEDSLEPWNNESLEQKDTSREQSFTSSSSSSNSKKEVRFDNMVQDMENPLLKVEEDIKLIKDVKELNELRKSPKIEGILKNKSKRRSFVEKKDKQPDGSMINILEAEEDLKKSTEAYKKNLEARIWTLEEFLINLSEFDIDTVSLLNPEKCLYRSIFLKAENNEEEEESAKSRLNKLNKGMIGQRVIIEEAMVSQEQREELERKTKMLIQGSLTNKSRYKKNVNNIGVKQLFCMQDVATRIIAKAIRTRSIDKNLFAECLYNQMLNINRHLVDYGGFFCFGIQLRNGDFFTFSESSKVKGYFKKVKIDFSPFNVLKDEMKKRAAKNLVIEDVFKVEERDELKAVSRSHRNMTSLVDEFNNFTFGACRPDKNVWSSLGLRIANESEVGQIESVMLLSINMMFSAQIGQFMNHRDSSKPLQVKLLYNFMKKAGIFESKAEIDEEDKFGNLDITDEVSEFLVSYMHFAQFLVALVERIDFKKKTFFEKMESCVHLFRED